MRNLVSVLMGSDSDYRVMIQAVEILKNFGVPFESKIISAHRTPDLMFEYVSSLIGKGFEVVIAGAGGAAHLPGMVASKTVLPVFGVPIERSINGLDALLSIVQMPRGVPVGTLAINNAENAAYLAISVLGNKYPEFREKLIEFRRGEVKRIKELNEED